MSRSLLGGKQVIKSCRLQEIGVKFIHSKQQKMKKTFRLKHLMSQCSGHAQKKETAASRCIHSR